MDGTITEPFFDFHAIEMEVGISGVDLVDHMLSVSAKERERIRRILQKHEDHAAENAPRDEDREIVSERVADGSHGEKQCSDDEQAFAARFVAERAGSQRAGIVDLRRRRLSDDPPDRSAYDAVDGDFGQ